MPALLDRAVVEKLVELVRLNSIIYDASHPEHKDIELTHAVWCDIAKAMGRRDLDGDGWKKKWRNLRDTYLKEKKEERKRRTRGQSAKKRPWRFSQELSFLDEFIEVSSTENDLKEPLGDVPSDGSLGMSGDVETARSTSLHPSQPDAEKRADSSHCTFSVASESRLSTGQMISTTKKARFVDSVPEDSANNPTSAEEAFFTSCAHRMKLLPAQTRSFLMLQISQLFFNAENRDIPPVPVTSLPPVQKLLP